MKILQYNYSSIDFENLPPKQKSMQADGYCKYILPLAATPCLTVDGPLQYSLSSIYIFSSPQHRLHPVLGNYQAELVLEHTPLTNGETLFLCFPIRAYTLQDKPTLIDDIIWRESSIQHLGALLGEGETFVYGSSVVLVKTPLFIQTDVSVFRGPADVLSSPAGSLIPQDGWLKNIETRPLVIEGFDEEIKVSDVIEDTGDGGGQYEYEMDCQPIDIGAENVPMLQVPYNSDTLANTSTKIFMSTTFSIFMTGFIVLLYVVLTPVLVPVIVDFVQLGDDKNKPSLIFILNLLLLFAAIIFVAYGTVVVKSRPGVLNAAFILLLLITGGVVSVYLFYMYKQPPYFNDIQDFLKSIAETFVFISTKMKIFAGISLIIEIILLGVGQIQAGLIFMITGTLILFGWLLRNIITPV